MHIRFTHCKGLPVVEEHSQEPLAYVSGVLVHPDMGKVEGFFVQVRHFLHSETLFLAVADIAHWGRMIVIRDRDALAPLEEHVRLDALLREGRTVLGQDVRNEEGATFGVCRDIQFETKTFRMEWIFTRALFRRGRSFPVASIIEVQTDAVIVRDQAAVAQPTEEEAAFAALSREPV